MISKFRNTIYNNLIHLFGDSKTNSIVRYKHKLMNYILKVQQRFLRNILSFFGFKKIIFKRYDLVNVKNDFPAIIFHGFNGITYIGSKKYINKRVFLKDYTHYPGYLSLKLIAELNNGFIPVSIFESNYLHFSGYELVQKKRKIKVGNSGGEINARILVGDKSLPAVHVPFLEGFFHFYIELIPTILQRLKSNCFILHIPRDSFYLAILDYFELNYVEFPSSDLYKFNSDLTIVKNGLYPTKNDLLVLRNYLSTILTHDLSGSVRIYITRRNNKNGRRVKNEKFILDFLIKLNFLIVDPDEMIFSEQIRLMQSASILISAHGAALSHLVCVPKECKVIELNGDTDVRWHYYKIAQHLGLDYMLLIGKTLNEKEFFIEVERIESALCLVSE
jgi:hypothetical protein